MVPQTDLVPTLALLLGIPIPYSSVGQVLLPLFPSHKQIEGAVACLSQLEALWINAKQVVPFIRKERSFIYNVSQKVSCYTYPGACSVIVCVFVCYL